MKKILYKIFIAILVIHSIEIKAQQKRNSDSSTIDFNGDGKIEYMWLESPKIASDGISCIGECNSYIRFSDTSLPSIFIKNTIGGSPISLGNLNMRNGDEIGIMDWWWQGEIYTYHVFTFKNRKPIDAVPSFAVEAYTDNPEMPPVNIDKNKKGNVLITYAYYDKMGYLKTKKKSIPIK